VKTYSEDEIQLAIQKADGLRDVLPQLNNKGFVDVVHLDGADNDFTAKLKLAIGDRTTGNSQAKYDAQMADIAARYENAWKGEE